METKRTVIIMSILFPAMQLVTIAIGLTTHPNISEIPKSYLPVLAFTLLISGGIGALAGFIYTKVHLFLPHYNLYLLTPVYLIITNLFLFLALWTIGQQGIGLVNTTLVNVNYIGLFIYAIIGGCLFSWMYQRSQQ